MSRLLSVSKNMVKWLLLKTDYDTRSFSKAHGVLALCCYSIPESDDWFYDIPADDFERHIVHLKERFRIVKAKELLESDESVAMSAPLRCTTLDDRYEDNFANALLIPREHDVPATFFVSSCNLDSTEQSSRSDGAPGKTNDVLERGARDGRGPAS